MENKIKEYMREILMHRTIMEYSTTKEDLFKRVDKKFKNLDSKDFEEILMQLLQDGEIYERFPQEFKWLN